MLTVLGTILGFFILLAQAAFAYNTMQHLSSNLPEFVGFAMVSLVIMFECVKPLLTIFIGHCRNHWGQFFSGLLLLCLSASSIYAMHFTMNYAVSGQLSEAEKIILHNLDLEQSAYFDAISKKGVVTASSLSLDKIKQQREELLSPQEDTDTNQHWALAISVLTELVIIACFSIGAYFSRERKIKRSIVGGGGSNQSHENKARMLEECPEIPKKAIGITENSKVSTSIHDEVVYLKDVKVIGIMRECKLGHDKAKPVIDYLSRLKKTLPDSYFENVKVGSLQ